MERIHIFWLHRLYRLKEKNGGDMIATFDIDTKEHRNLRWAALLLNQLACDNGYKELYEVKDTYFDFDEDWTWTTRCYGSGTKDSFQALQPKYQQEFIEGNYQGIPHVFNQQKRILVER